jgi:hypothetical protein
LAQRLSSNMGLNQQREQVQSSTKVYKDLTPEGLNGNASKERQWSKGGNVETKYTKKTFLSYPSNIEPRGVRIEA